MTTTMTREMIGDEVLDQIHIVRYAEDTMSAADAMRYHLGLDLTNAARDDESVARHIAFDEFHSFSRTLLARSTRAYLELKITRDRYITFLNAIVENLEAA